MIRTNGKSAHKITDEFISKIIHHAEYTHINEELLEELSFIVAWVIITMVSLIDRGYTCFVEVQMQVESLDKCQQY